MKKISWAGKELIIKLVCILILVILCISIYINGKDLSCNKCKLTISKKEGMNTNIYQINISTLYESYKNNQCYSFKLEDIR